MRSVFHICEIVHAYVRLVYVLIIKAQIEHNITLHNHLITYINNLDNNLF